MRTLVSVLTACGLAAGLPAPAAAPQDRGGEDRGRFFDAETRAAVERGLAWLAAKQNPNGSWTNRVGYKLYDDYFGEDNDSVDVTAIAGMAFLAGGHVPGRGKYGGSIKRAVEWLLTKVRDEDGYISHGGSRMYSHAFATLFLAEVYGMTRQDAIKPKLKRAIDLIVNSQNKEGGWRYQPIPVDADLSVTVSTLQALRAARNVGISVPLDTIQKATRYVENCATRRGFTYQSVAGYGISDTRVSFALTACGIVSLYSAGQYDSFRVRDALRVLPQWRHTLVSNKLHYYYGHYYACQAMYLAGGQYWTDYYPVVRTEILKMQKEQGYWEDEVGAPYATAMACVILQIPCEYLPIFQK
jgi:hypothetical protein